MDESDVLAFARDTFSEFDGVSYKGRWHGFDVYDPYSSEGPLFIGLPSFILVSSDGSMRWAEGDEAFQIMDDMACFRCEDD